MLRKEQVFAYSGLFMKTKNEASAPNEELPQEQGLLGNVRQWGE